MISMVSIFTLFAVACLTMGVFDRRHRQIWFAASGTLLFLPFINDLSEEFSSKFSVAKLDNTSGPANIIINDTFPVMSNQSEPHYFNSSEESVFDTTDIFSTGDLLD